MGSPCRRHGIRTCTSFKRCTRNRSQSLQEPITSAVHISPYLACCLLGLAVKVGSQVLLDFSYRRCLLELCEWLASFGSGATGKRTFSYPLRIATMR